MKATKAQAAALAKNLAVEMKNLGRTKPRTTRKEAKGPYHTYCTTCEEEFHSMAAETRHMTATDHHDYRLVTQRDETAP